MKRALRELREDITMLLNRTIELEQWVRELDRGPVTGGELHDRYRRTFTGTFRGSQRELAALPDTSDEHDL